MIKKNSQATTHNGAIEKIHITIRQRLSHIIMLIIFLLKKTKNKKPTISWRHPYYFCWLICKTFHSNICQAILFSTLLLQREILSIRSEDRILWPAGKQTRLKNQWHIALKRELCKSDFIVLLHFLVFQWIRVVSVWATSRHNLSVVGLK